MAPRGKRGDGGDLAEPQAFHELGVRGRKTGKVLRDTGERDEHGMQPLEDIFSSPRKREDNGTARDVGNNDGDGDGSEDMEISNSGGPGPRTVLRRSMQNRSSPSQDSNDDTAVSRKLDFGGGSKPKANGKPKGATLNGNGSIHRDDSEDIEAILGGGVNELAAENMDEPSMMMVEGEGEEPKTQQKRGRGRPKTTPVSEHKAAPKPGAKATSKPAKVHSPSPEPEEQPVGLEVVEEGEEEEREDQEVEHQPVPKRRGRPPAKTSQSQRELPPPEKPSRKRRSADVDPVVAGASYQSEPQDGTPRKKQRTLGLTVTKPGPSKPQAVEKRKSAAPVPTPAAQPRARGRPGRKPKSSTSGPATSAGRGAVEGEASFVQLQRGPPMPKSRGLVSVHKDNAITRTRSGRNSIRPVAYWRGEQAVLEEEEQDDMFNRKSGFIMPKIKEVVRVPLDEPPAKRAAAARGKGRPKLKKAVADEEPLEEWETNPGVVEGEIVIWEPEHEEHPPADDEAVQVTDERIAISASAIQTSDIRDATFRFAKTLTMPFMGAGVVDLPPGGEKRPKNSRKMHMVFFVHQGKVMVTINEAQFRISAGGMWFVPRGNYYSITNDYDSPARVFFCQACELSAAFADSTQLSMA